MQRQRRRDTAPEVALRKELWHLGLRYRVHHPVLNSRQRVDVAFTRARVAVFVDGCFWHGCPDHGSTPKHNAEWWRSKLESNSLRDRTTDAALEAAGWTVVRVWEHEQPAIAADRIAQLVTGRTASELGERSPRDSK